MEPGPSHACETKGLSRQDLPSRPKIFFFTRPDILLNNSPHCVQVILPTADTAPNICSRASSHFQTSLDFFTMELGDDSSPIQMGTPRDNVHPQPLSGTETAPALTSHPPGGKGLWPLPRVGVPCTQYRHAATRGRRSESIHNKGEKKRKNSFRCFPFLPKLKRQNS